MSLMLARYDYSEVTNEYIPNDVGKPIPEFNLYFESKLLTSSDSVSNMYDSDNFNGTRDQFYIETLDGTPISNVTFYFREYSGSFIWTKFDVPVSKTSSRLEFRLTKEVSQGKVFKILNVDTGVEETYRPTAGSGNALLLPIIEVAGEPVVTKEQESKTEVVPYERTRQENPDLDKGEENVIQTGVDGVRTITEEVTYTDGVETDREVISDVVDPEPITEITEYGTKPIITTETITELLSVPYDKVIEEDPTKPITFSAITTEGVEGVETVTYEVTYTDGVETDRVEVSRVITTEPVTEVTTVGTMTDYVYLTKVLEHGKIDFDMNVYDNMGTKLESNTLVYGTYRVEIARIGSNDSIKSGIIELGNETKSFNNYLDKAEVTIVVDSNTNKTVNVKAELNTLNIATGSATLTHSAESYTNYTVDKESGSKVTSKEAILVKADEGYRVDKLEITYTYTDGFFPETRSITIEKPEPDSYLAFRYGEKFTYKSSKIDMKVVVSKLGPVDPVDPDPVDPEPEEPVEVTIMYIDELERASSNMVSGTSKLIKTDTVIITANFGYVFQDEVRIVPSNVFDFNIISLHPDTSPEFNADRTVITIPVSSLWTPLHDTDPPVSYEFIATASEKLQTEGLVTNFTKVYTVTVAELDKLSRERFYNPLDGSEYADYGEYIYSLYSVPLAVPESIISLDKADIQLGQFKATTASYTLLDRRILFNLGQIEVPEEYGNVYDYINTVCLIHVPYQEQPISIDNTYVIGESIGLMLALDLYSGEASLAITSSKINGGLVKRVDIPLTHDIPFMRTYRDTLKDKVGKLVYNEVTTPYIELIRNVPYETNSVFGKGSRDFVVLGSLSGYVEVEDSLVNTNATEAERNAISGLLKQGVYINDPLVP